MLNNITHLNKVNIEEYRKNHPQFHLLVKRISETEGYLLAVSPSKFTEVDLLDDNINQGFKPESLEIVQALIPDLSIYNGFNEDEDL